MTDYKIHMVHVGNMRNKGTQALFSADVKTINELVDGNVSISVSTTDVEGINALSLPLKGVLPTIVDIPFRRADDFVKKIGLSRNRFEYRLAAIFYLIVMFYQTLFTVFSVLFSKIGLKAFYREEIVNAIKNSDIVVSCSDENFKEAASLLPLKIDWMITWWTLLFQRMLEVLIAKFFSKPVVMFPNSIGPFRTFIGRTMSYISMNSCDYLAIRDTISYEILESLDVSGTTLLTADTALMFESEKSLTKKRPKTIGVCAGVYNQSLLKHQVENYIESHALALDEAIEKFGVEVYFVPHYMTGLRYDDEEISKLILEKMKNKQNCHIVCLPHASEFRTFLSEMSMVISSKMHPAVLCTSAFVPSICIAYDHKQFGFYKHLKMQENVIKIQTISSDLLFKKIEMVWTNKSQIHQSLKEVVPVLQNHVKNTFRTILKSYVKLKN